MREIKFRAWDKTNRIMIYDDVWIHCYGTKSNFPDIHIAEIPCDKTYDPRTDVDIMQFTGLRDKNYKEIYEGDIVLWAGRDKEEKPDIYTVRWDDIHCGFVVDVVLTSGTKLKSESIIGDWEVIGNIYENPELLEEPHQ